MYRVIERKAEGYKLSRRLEVIYTGRYWRDSKGRQYSPVRYRGVIVGFTRKDTLTEEQRALYSGSEEGRVYIAYNHAIGGDRICLEVPVGYPEGVEKQGGTIAVYEKCIRQGITWEELLGCYYGYEPTLIDGGWKPLEMAYKLTKSP